MYSVLIAGLCYTATLATAAIHTAPVPLVTGLPQSNASRHGHLWQPRAHEKWDYLILAPLYPNVTGQPTDVKVLDIDLFDNSNATIGALQAAGKHVICYFSAGSYEVWRSDCVDFKQAELGTPVKDDLREDGMWPGEWWVDVRSPNVRRIMSERLKVAKSKGCNGVEPDNMDGYSDDHKGGGFNLTENDYMDYLRFLAREASSLNLSIGLKNAIEILDQIQDVIQFAVNEQAVSLDETSKYDDFLGGKYNGSYRGVERPVFNVEYVEAYASAKNKSKSLVAGMLQEGKRTDPSLLADLFSSFCQQNRTLSTILKLQSLNGWRFDCDRNEHWTQINIKGTPNKLKPAVPTCPVGRKLVVPNNSTNSTGFINSANSTKSRRPTTRSRYGLRARMVRKTFRTTWLNYH